MKLCLRFSAWLFQDPCEDILFLCCSSPKQFWLFQREEKLFNILIYLGTRHIVLKVALSTLCYPNSLFILKYILRHNIYDLTDFIKGGMILIAQKHFHLSKFIEVIYFFNEDYV